MNKSQAIQSFWESFKIPAYDELTVPDNAQFPYITYNVKTDSIGNICLMSASLWYRSTSWKEVSDKAEEIAECIVTMTPPSIEIDNGRLYISKGTPFAQRMTEPSDDMVRRIYININAEFLTAF